MTVPRSKTKICEEICIPAGKLKQAGNAYIGLRPFQGKHIVLASDGYLFIPNMSSLYTCNIPLDRLMRAVRDRKYLSHNILTHHIYKSKSDFQKRVYNLLYRKRHWYCMICPFCTFDTSISNASLSPYYSLTLSLLLSLSLSLSLSLFLIHSRSPPPPPPPSFNASSPTHSPISVCLVYVI